MDSKEIEELDSWFQGVSQPSRRIRELVQRKRRKHEALARQLRQQLFKERSETERNIAFISTSLKRELDKASLMIKLKRDRLVKCTANFKESVSAAWEVVRGLTEQRQRAVEAFYDLLVDAEAELQQRSKTTVSKYRGLMESNGHLPPPQLQLFVDAETKDLGEAHLRHIITFGDLRFCLNMHAERDCRKFQESVENLRRVTLERFQRASLNILQQASNKTIDEYINLTSMGRDSLASFEKKIAQLKDSACHSTQYPFSASDIKPWEGSLISSLQELDAAAMKIIDGFKDGLELQQTWCSEEIEKLRKCLIENDLCTHEKFQAMSDLVCKPLLNILQQKYTEDPQSLLICWKEWQAKLATEINSLVSVMKDAGVLWDQVHEKQKLERYKINLNLQQNAGNRGKSVEAKERRLAEVVKKSKEEINRPRLEENLQRIFRILDEIRSSYEMTHKTEIEVLQTCFTSCEQETVILKDLFNNYFNKHQVDVTQEDRGVVNKYSTKVLELTEEADNFLKLQKKTWLKDIKSFIVNESNTFIKQDAQTWMTEQLNGLEREYNGIFKEHESRYEQLRYKVQIERLEELENHAKILENQKEILAKTLHNIQEDFECSLAQGLKTFADFQTNIFELKERALKDFSAYSVKKTIIEVETKFTKCKDMVTALINEYQSTILGKIHELKLKNNGFMASIKHFSDGGNFATAEITNIRSEIGTLEQDVEAQGKRNLQSLKQKSKSCCADTIEILRICLSELQVHLEDLIFSDNVSTLVKKIQGQLKKRVLELKYGGKVLQEQIKDLTVKGTDLNDSPEFSDRWRCVLKSVETRLECLFSRYKRDGEEEKNESEKFYSKELMEYKTTSGFLSVIFHLLKRSLQEIETTVIDFHKHKVQGNVLSPSSLDEIQNLMSELCSKYKLYQEQCIFVWLSELHDFLNMLLSLRLRHDAYCQEIVCYLRDALSHSLTSEERIFKIELTNLRKNYQNYQVETMKRINPILGFLGNPHSIHTLCCKFERTTKLLTQRAESLLSSFLLKAEEHFQRFTEDIQQQMNSFVSINEGFNSKEFISNLLEMIAWDSNHLVRHYSKFIQTGVKQCPESLCSKALVLKEDKFKITSKCKNDCPLNIKKALQNLGASKNEFFENYKMEVQNSKYASSYLISKEVQLNLKKAKMLVQNKTSEATYLHAQYKDMAEELRLKWKNTMDQIQQVQVGTT